VPLAAGWLAV